MLKACVVVLVAINVVCLADDLPINALKIGNSKHDSIANQVELGRRNPTTSILFCGQRPEGDAPKDGAKVFGRRLGDGDWLLQERDDAVWVSETPAPPVGAQVVVHGFVVETGGDVRVKAIHLFKDAGRQGRNARTLRKGEYLYVGLSSSKSTYEEVETEGDSVKRCYYSGSCAVFEAVKSGSTTIRLLLRWSMNIDAPPDRPTEFELIVHE